jgi:hypothetical protein
MILVLAKSFHCLLRQIWSIIWWKFWDWTNGSHVWSSESFSPRHICLQANLVIGIWFFACHLLEMGLDKLGLFKAQISLGKQRISLQAKLVIRTWFFAHHLVENYGFGHNWICLKLRWSLQDTFLCKLNKWSEYNSLLLTWWKWHWTNWICLKLTGPRHIC